MKHRSKFLIALALLGVGFAALVWVSLSPEEKTELVLRAGSLFEP